MVRRRGGAPGQPLETWTSRHCCFGAEACIIGDDGEGRAAPHEMNQAAEVHLGIK